MIQKDILNFLKETHTMAKILKEAKRYELAEQVLRTGTTVALFALSVDKLKNLPLRCFPLGHELKGKTEREVYLKKGICMWCDHLAEDHHQEEQYDN